MIFCFSDSPWSCRFCTNPYDFSLVSRDIDRIEQELYSIIDSNTNTAQLLLKFVSKYSDKLHSKHYLNLLGKTRADSLTRLESAVMMMEIIPSRNANDQHALYY